MKRVAITYLRFIDRLGAKPTPAQRIAFGVMCDGIEPGALEGDDRATARQLFGDVETVPALAREVAVLVKGARVGGTWLGSLRLMHLSLTVPLDTLAPGELASALIVAPDMRLGRQALRYALGAARRDKALAARVGNVTSTSFTIKRDDGRRVIIECLPATRGGSALRGRSLVGALFTEFAFVRDADYVVNDVELFRAVVPRVLKGGQVLLESTPFAEVGLLYDLWKENFGKPATAIVAHAPTLVMRTDARMRGIVERERLRDPDNARREFDAEFMSAGAGLFFNPAAIDRCVVDGRQLPMPRPAGARVGAGGDLGLRSDASAIAVVARGADDAFDLLAIEEARPEKGKPLRFSTVMESWSALAKEAGCARVMADLTYVEAVREHLEKQSLELVAVPTGQAGKAQTYIELRNLVNDGRLRLPDHPRLIAQLKAVTSRPTSGGGMSISSPRKGGAHGDLVSALVCAAWSVRGERETARLFIGESDRGYGSRGGMYEHRH